MAGIWDEEEASDVLTGVRVMNEWGGVVEHLVGKEWEEWNDWVASHKALGVLTGQWESKCMKPEDLTAWCLICGGDRKIKATFGDLQVKLGSQESGKVQLGKR